MEALSLLFIIQCPFSLYCSTSCISLSLPPTGILRALLSGDLEGGHTDQKSAAEQYIHKVVSE